MLCRLHALLVFVFFTFLISNSYADTIVVQDRFRDVLIPSSAFLCLEDTSGKLTFEEVIELQQQRKFEFRKALKQNTLYWIRFTLLNKTDPAANWILQLPLHSEEVLVYMLNPDGTHQQYHTGQKLSFNSRSIALRTLAFELPNRKDMPLDVYIRVYNKRYTDLSFIVINEKNYLETHTRGYMFFGLIYGILFLMVVYNLILYVSIRERIYIYYVLYIISSAFFLSRKDGLAFQFLWPDSPWINEYHHPLSLFLLLLTFLLYANNFINIRYKNPKIFLLNGLIILLNLAYFLWSIIDESYFDPMPWICILSFIYFLGMTIFYLNKKYQPARYLVVGLSCMVGALVILKLLHLRWVEWNWFIEYVLNYAVVVDAIAMSLAIGDKITYLRNKDEEVRHAKLVEEKLKAENELMQLKNQTLESEVTHQHNELSVFATNSIQKTEFMNQLKKELGEMLKEMPDNASLKRLIKTIEKEADFDDDWEQFQLNFDKAHDNFLLRLKQAYPILKPGDLMLCAYTLLGKSNKEIAALLNITISGVEKKRGRLKEKMSIDQEISLSDFLLHIK